MHSGRILACLGGALLAIGCDSADSTGPMADLQPLFSSGAIPTAMAPDGYETPVIESRDAAPADWIARFTNFTVGVEWDGFDVAGKTSVDWFGNRFSASRVMTIDNRDKPGLETVAGKVWPFEYETWRPDPAEYATYGECNQVADFTVTVDVKVYALAKDNLAILQLDEDGDTKVSSKVQPPIPHHCPEDPPPSSGGGGTSVISATHTQDEPPANPHCMVKVYYFQPISGVWTAIGGGHYEPCHLAPTYTYPSNMPPVPVT